MNFFQSKILTTFTPVFQLKNELTSANSHKPHEAT
jgi:hypothetical protein